MKRFVRINERIYSKTLRVIGPHGEQLGIFPRDIALKKAAEYNLDLVEVAPQSDPPVCRIMDFEKYKYEQEKREREARKHQKYTQLKEIRFSPRIDNHDYTTKVKHIQEFLKKGHKVRVRLFFKGREMTHQDLGKKVIDRLMEDISKTGKVEKPPYNIGRSIIVIFSPK